MSLEKLKKLKEEATLLESLLIKESSNSEEAKQLLNELQSVFTQVRTMASYQLIGRLRYDRLFMEGELANNTQLADCYCRFANLAEGIEV